jgi:hypothetical protein
MYSTKSVNGVPAILYKGRSVLSVWNDDWNFAYELCAVLNGLAYQRPSLLLTESDRKWLRAIDDAFKARVLHA